jgi:ABC-type branched-subunit amino acid transport system substrate-binding protein
MKEPSMRARLKALVVMVAAMAALAACGGSGGGAGGTDNKIKIMAVGTWDSPGTIDGRPILQIIDNDAAVVNKAGGINGKQIEVIRCNEKGNPNEAEKCARQAVSENVTALVGGGSLSASKMWPILNTKKISWVAPYASQPQDLTDPMSVSLIGGSLLYTGPSYLAGQECKRVARLVAADKIGKTNMAFSDAGLKAAGGQWAKEVTIPASAKDMSAPVAAAAQANPDCVVVENLDPTQWTQIIQQYSQQGLQGKVRVYSIQPSSVTYDLLKQFPKETDGFTLVGYFPDVYSEPAWKSYVDTQTQANNLGDRLANIGDSSQTRYHVAFEVFQQITKSMKGNDFSSAAFTDTLNKSCSVNIGPIAPTFNFCQENPVSNLKRVFNTNFSFYKASNGSLTAYQPGFHDMLPIYRKGSGQ